MKREIKFRAWSGDQMHYTQDENRNTQSMFTAGDILDRFETVMQYTGLKDKNGVEVYEGDLVKYSIKERFCKNKQCDTGRKMGINEFCSSCGTKTEIDDFITIAKVVWDKAAFAYRNEVDEDHYISWNCYANEMYIAWVEVIGNIHQNPELLP